MLGVALLVVPQHDQAAVVANEELVGVSRRLADGFHCAGVHLEVIGNTGKMKILVLKNLQNIFSPC